VQAPVLMMYGADTFPFVIKSAALWRKSNSNLLTEQVDGGHCFMQQHPESAAASVRAFLLTQD